MIWLLLAVVLAASAVSCDTFFNPLHNYDPCAAAGTNGGYVSLLYVSTWSPSVPLNGQSSQSSFVDDTLYISCITSSTQLYALRSFSSSTPTSAPIEYSFASASGCGAAPEFTVYSFGEALVETAGNWAYNTGLYYTCSDGSIRCLIHSSGSSSPSDHNLIRPNDQGSAGPSNAPAVCAAAMPMTYGVLGQCTLSGTAQWVDYYYGSYLNTPDIDTTHQPAFFAWGPRNAAVTGIDQTPFFFYDTNGLLYVYEWVVAGTQYYLTRTQTLSSVQASCSQLLFIDSPNGPYLYLLCQSTVFRIHLTITGSSATASTVTFGSVSVVTRVCTSPAQMTYNPDNNPDFVAVACNAPVVSIFIINNPGAGSPSIKYFTPQANTLDVLFAITSATSFVIYGGAKSSIPVLQATSSYTQQSPVATAWYELFPTADCSGQPDTSNSIATATHVSLGTRGCVVATCLLDGNYVLDVYPGDGCSSGDAMTSTFTSSGGGTCASNLFDGFSFRVHCTGSFPGVFSTQGWYSMYPSSGCTGTPDTVNTAQMSTFFSLGSRGNAFMTCYNSGSYLLEVYGTSNTRGDTPIAHPSASDGVCISGALLTGASIAVHCTGTPPSPPSTGWYAVFPDAACGGDPKYAPSITFGSQTTVPDTLGFVVATCSNTYQVSITFYASDFTTVQSSATVASGSCIGPGKLFKNYAMSIVCGNSPSQPVLPSAAYYSVYGSSNCGDIPVQNSFTLQSYTSLGGRGCVFATCYSDNSYLLELYPVGCDHTAHPLAWGTFSNSQCSNSFVALFLGFSISVTCSVSSAPAVYTTTGSWYIYPSPDCSGGYSIQNNNIAINQYLSAGWAGWIYALCINTAFGVANEVLTYPTSGGSDSVQPLHISEQADGACVTGVLPDSGSIKLFCETGSASLPTSGWVEAFEGTGCHGVPDYYLSVSMQNTYNLTNGRGCIKPICQNNGVGFVVEVYNSATCDTSAGPLTYASATTDGGCASISGWWSVKVHCSGSAPTPVAPLDSSSKWVDAFAGQQASYCPHNSISSAVYVYNYHRSSAARSSISSTAAQYIEDTLFFVCGNDGVYAIEYFSLALGVALYSPLTLLFQSQDKTNGNNNGLLQPTILTSSSYGESRNLEIDLYFFAGGYSNTIALPRPAEASTLGTVAFVSTMPLAISDPSGARSCRYAIPTLLGLLAQCQLTSSNTGPYGWFDFFYGWTSPPRQLDGSLGSTSSAAVDSTGSIDYVLLMSPVGPTFFVYGVVPTNTTLQQLSPVGISLGLSNTFCNQLVSASKGAFFAACSTTASGNNTKLLFVQVSFTGPAVAPTPTVVFGHFVATSCIAITAIAYNNQTDTFAFACSYINTGVYLMTTPRGVYQLSFVPANATNECTDINSLSISGPNNLLVVSCSQGSKLLATNSYTQQAPSGPNYSPYCGASMCGSANNQGCCICSPQDWSARVTGCCQGNNQYSTTGSYACSCSTTSTNVYSGFECLNDITNCYRGGAAAAQGNAVVCSNNHGVCTSVNASYSFCQCNPDPQYQCSGGSCGTTTANALHAYNLPYQGQWCEANACGVIPNNGYCTVTSRNPDSSIAQFVAFCYPVFSGSYCQGSRCKSASLAVVPNHCMCDPTYSTNSTIISASYTHQYIVDILATTSSGSGDPTATLTVCYTGCPRYGSPLATAGSSCGPSGTPTGITQDARASLVTSSCLPLDGLNSIGYGYTFTQSSYCVCGTGYVWATPPIGSGFDANTATQGVGLPATDYWGTCSAYCSNYLVGYTAYQWNVDVTCVQSQSGSPFNNCYRSSNENPCRTVIPSTVSISSSSSSVYSSSSSSLISSSSSSTASTALASSSSSSSFNASTTPAGTTTQTPTTSTPTTPATTTTMGPTTAPVPTTVSPTTSSATTTPASNATTQAPASSSGLSTATIGAIVGGVVGGTVVIAVIVYVIVKGSAAAVAANAVVAL